jgi:CRISPR/Cas system-associated protein Csm6
LARARQDPAFRHQLVADNLELLLAALNKVRNQTGPDKAISHQIREGVDLAVKLADLLQRLELADFVAEVRCGLLRPMILSLSRRFGHRRGRR